MAWSNDLIQHLANVDVLTRRENDFYGVFITLLVELFPIADGHTIFPQYRGGFGIIDFVVCRGRIPLFFVEVKASWKLDRISTRAAADAQMRQRFQEILEDFPNIPFHTIIGISAMGTQFAVYKCTTRENGQRIFRIRPGQTTRSIMYVNDTAPRSRWRYDLTSATGETRLRSLAREIRRMVLEMQ